MKRNRFLEKIIAHFHVHQVCVVLGPRQVGKTTLARAYIKKYAQEACGLETIANGTFKLT